MMRRTTFVCLLVTALCFLPLTVSAEHTRQWRESDFAEFQKGTADGVAIRSDGKLLPAPKFDVFADPNLAYVWELRMDSQGRLFAAGGSDAKVLRFDDAGKPTTVFESSELAAQAIAFDSKNNLYVGTSPDGKVYKTTPDGQKTVFFDPKTKYIWALAMDTQGSLFVATGDKGEIFVVSPDGKGQLFYQSEERHARSLAFDPQGNLLVGTEPDGLIIRVDVQRKGAGKVPTAGSPFVIYETNKAEVTSLLADTKGNIYASSVGEKVRIQALPRMLPNIVTSQPTPSAAGGPGGIVIQGQSATPQQATQYPFPVSGGGAEVVKISPDGSPETLWSSRDDLVYSMGLTPAGKILLGSGDKGTIIELEGGQIYSNIAKTNSAQVTSLLPGPGGKIFAATANAGKIFTLGPGYDINGRFESDAFDAKIFSHWGRLTWWGENGAPGDKVAFYVRSGNTSNPDNNWSPWAGPYQAAGASAVVSPPARFVQWKVVFRDADGSRPPSVSWVSLAYQPTNVPPVIDDIALQDSGIRVVGFAQQPNGPGTSAPVQLRTPHGPGASPSVPPMTTEASARAAKVEVPPQGFEGHGYQSVLWSAHDDNDDDLLFTVDYRGEGEQNWHLLKDKLTQKYYSWDTTSMPDGAYYLKIVASDSPSNPADQSLSTERESDRFEVANTPPKIENLHAEAHGTSVKVSFEGVSSADAIARAQYSLDAGDWKIVLPVGQLSDAPKESYQVEIAGVSLGQHTVAVQVTDGFDNAAAGEVTFTMPPEAK
jgi:sugar lactone lactonase YvrE/flavin-binding protein dodecin